MSMLSVVSKATIGALALVLATSAIGDEVRPPENARERQQAQGRQRGDQQTQLQDYFAHKLLLANRGEIELARVAEQRSTNPEVKQFAATLIRDHEKLDAKVAQAAPNAAAQFAAWDRQRAPGAAETAERTRPADPAAERQTRTAARDEAAGHSELRKLTKINHEACRIHTQMCKEMLEKHKGQDFDMAYLGSQIGAHAALLAELKAIGETGDPQFQQLVAEARQSVEDHLTKAKELAKKFEDDRGRTSS